MNALVGQEAKANCSLVLLVCDEGADDGSRKDGGDFTSTGAGGHLRGRCKFEVLHDGSEELQPSQMMCVMFRSGWQFRVIGDETFALTKQLTDRKTRSTLTQLTNHATRKHPCLSEPSFAKCAKRSRFR